MTVSFPARTRRRVPRTRSSSSFENALVVTFLYGQSYECNEYCKYYKNAGNVQYKFIPSVHRTYSDGNVTHVTGIVTITADEFEAMPPHVRRPVAPRQLSRRRRIDGSLHRQDQGGDAWRDHR